MSDGNIFYTNTPWYCDADKEHKPIGWYHLDEVQSRVYGPFNSKQNAEVALEKYCNYLDTGEYA